MSGPLREPLPPTVEEKKLLEKLLAKKQQLCVHCMSPRYFHNLKIHIAKAHKNIKESNVIVAVPEFDHNDWDHG
jgi:hypothetical protein